jgi:predicted RNA-binding protein YlxR (DUF448 family)
VAQARSDEWRPPKRDAARRRLCIATRTARPVAAMLRFVAVAGGVVPDLERKLPGRGVWVTARRALVEEAARRGAFARGLKAKVKTPAGLPGMIEELLERSVLERCFAPARRGSSCGNLPEPGSSAGTGGSWPSCAPAMARRISRFRGPAVAMGSKSSSPSQPLNWIWHWDA